MAFAAASYAQIFQNGLQQYAEQVRNGENQTGIIRQQNAGGENYGNYAITYQGVPTNGGPNEANINQRGGSQGNRAGISQIGGPGNLANINQNGGSQGLSGGGVSGSATIGSAANDGNFGGILQQGQGNVALLEQNNNSRRNGAEYWQNGTQNAGSINQSNGSVNNDAFIFQGYQGQNVQGTATTGAQALIYQGRVDANDISTSGVIPEAVASRATITQLASAVVAGISQGSRGLAGGATGESGRADGVEATILQTQVASVAYIEQGSVSGEAVGSRASIVQNGSSDVAFVFQGSNANGSDLNSVANITQIGNGGTIANAAYITQGSFGATDNNTANITQGANVQLGVASIRQGNGIGSFSSDDQATINQNSTATTLNLTGAFIVQNSSQDFTGAGGGESNGRSNRATITQGTGVTNALAIIDQGSAQAGEFIQSNRNTATITQTGATNSSSRARISQGKTNPQDATGATIPLVDIGGQAFTIGQLSNDNNATINQTGPNILNNAVIAQQGRFNTGAINQTGGSGTTALIIQSSGSIRGQAVINQSSTGSGNSATILQFTGSNADGLDGFGNRAIINQIGIGSNNIAFLQQGRATDVASSNDNFITLTQNGSNNVTRFLQQGNNNFADITQNGNNNIVKGQGANNDIASQNGYNNRLTLVQNGNSSSNLVYSYTQNGNNNTQNVVQNAN
ncbi:hypothetical protein GCM10027341_42270 [Spirosoma knui]